MREKVKPPPDPLRYLGRRLDVSTLPWGEHYRIPVEAVDIMAADPRRYGFHWNALSNLWERPSRNGYFDTLYADPPLPFFLDPRQIEELTPEIDWSRRVGDRIRSFLEWGREGAA